MNLKNETTNKMIDDALGKHRCVIHSLEGLGKSSLLAKKVYDSLKPDEYAIIGSKNYALMSEQRKNWIKKYGWKETDIVILGDVTPGKKGQKNPNAEFVTNPTKNGCYFVPRLAKIVFMSHAAIQKCNHVTRLHAEPMENRKARHRTRLIIDEFDFTSSLLPRFAYAYSSCLSNKQKDNKPEAGISKWIAKRFTKADVDTMQLHMDDDKYQVAHWISSEITPITYLTSENLACKFLERNRF